MFKQLNIKIENTCKSNKGFIEESIEKYIHPIANSLR